MSEATDQPQSWRIGDVTITKIVEMEVAGGTKFILPQATKEAAREITWLAPHFATDEGRLIMSIHALVIDTGERRIVVDTCIGNDKERSIPGWNDLQTSFLDDLTAAGYAPETIDTVLCTHLHVDHVGWNTQLVDGQWVPTFKSARYLLARDEYEHWSSGEDEDAYGDVMGDSVEPVMAAGLVDLVALDHRVCDEVALMPSTGHTPGHVSVVISSQGETAVITGDFLHHPCQMSRPEWSSTADSDPDQAIRTRRRLLAEWSDTDTVVIGTHFATPTAGRVRPLAADGDRSGKGASDGAGYWLDVDLSRRASPAD